MGPRDKWVRCEWDSPKDVGAAVRMVKASSTQTSETPQLWSHAHRGDDDDDDDDDNDDDAWRVYHVCNRVSSTVF